MSLITWLNNRYPEGIYKGGLSPCLEWCEQKLSIQKYCNNKLEEKYGRNGKAPAWFAELFQLVSLLLAIVLLCVINRLPVFCRYLVVLIAIYRILDITLFATNWVFVHKDKPRSSKRSLASFLVNISEIVLLYSVAYVGFHCICQPNFLTALYSSLRTVVTIGPTSSIIEEPSRCVALLSSEIVVSYFLTIIVIANIAGAVKR